MTDAPLALVTGASSGIGAEISRQLAAKGHDLVLVARFAPGLEQLASEVAERGVVPSVLRADLATTAGIDTVANVIVERAPDVVVNNAGFGWHGDFLAHLDDALTEMVMVNALAVARLSRVAMEVMVPRGSGGILNVSSVASFVPGPSVAAYHATKAFVTSLSEALHVEAIGTGVRVTALCPGITPTGFQQRAGTMHGRLPRFMSTPAQRVAREGLIALARGDAICVPGAVYKAIAALAKVAPRALVRRVAASVIERV